MPGITKFGAYIPPTRLPLALLAGREAREGGPEKAVAGHDEDAVTMGVAAAVDCLRGRNRGDIDGVFFASTTHAFGEKQAAALIARALDLRADLRSIDFGGSLRSGLSALGAALDAVAAGSAQSILVIASDARMAAPRSPMEAKLGDAAVAFLVGDDAVGAEFIAGFAISDEIVDTWRAADDRFVHSWEERFVVQEGYIPKMQAAVEGLLEKTDTAVGDIQRAALQAPDARSHATLARQLGFDDAALEAPLFGRVGNAGTAFAPLLLASALETAGPDENVVVASYGDGAEALAFRTTAAIAGARAGSGVAGHLKTRRAIASYDRYLQARNLLPREWSPAADPGLSATVHFRERNEDLAFKGQACRACGALQFPFQRVCESCFAKDDFDAVRLSDRRGRVVTYTLDYFFPTPNPPTIVTVTDIDGARVHLQLVDCAAEDVRPGLEVEFVFRRIHEGGGRPNYYWKGRPVAVTGESGGRA